MIKAEIKIRTCYGDPLIPVEVIGNGPRPGTVRIQALDGFRPFTRTSHGGPCQESQTVVSISLLRDLRIEVDLTSLPLNEPISLNMELLQVQPEEISVSADIKAEDALPIWIKQPAGG